MSPLPVILLSLVVSLPSLWAQGGVTITDDVTAQVSAQRIQVQITGTDAVLIEQVRQALGLHGAFTLTSNAGVRLSIDRAGNSARVSSAQPGYAFETEVQGRDSADLALRTADAAVVGLGKRFNLLPIFAETRVAFLSRIAVGRHEV
jgi:hypothetical protein